MWSSLPRLVRGAVETYVSGKPTTFVTMILLKGRIAKPLVLRTLIIVRLDPLYAPYIYLEGWRPMLKRVFALRILLQLYV